MKGVTSYKGISKIYFNYLISEIINIASLDSRNIKILDFGCGIGQLKKLLGEKVISFDKVEELSDISDWRDMEFEVMVVNQVFYTFTKEELESLLKELKSRKKRIELVVGISRQGILNNLGKILLGKLNSHSGTKINPKTEIETLLNYCKLIKKRNIFFLAEIYQLELN